VTCHEEHRERGHDADQRRHTDDHPQSHADWVVIRPISSRISASTAADGARRWLQNGSAAPGRPPGTSRPARSVPITREDFEVTGPASEPRVLLSQGTFDLVQFVLVFLGQRHGSPPNR
jgi:hypothetical protein